MRTILISIMIESPKSIDKILKEFDHGNTQVLAMFTWLATLMQMLRHANVLDVRINRTKSP